MSKVPDPIAPLGRRRRAAAAAERVARETQISARCGAARRRAQWRMGLLGTAFGLAFSVVAFQMTALALSDPREPTGGGHPMQRSERADIVDRNGFVMATNVRAWSLYAHPDELVDKVEAAEKLASVFPDLDAKKLAHRLNDGRKFIWIKRPISPDQKQRVHELGLPGLYFGQREARVYPAGRIAAHVLGGVRTDKEGVSYADLVGVGGVEGYFNSALNNPERDAPLQLSIDMRAQMAMHEILARAVKRFNAKGAAGVLMDARTGEVLSLVSLPDFDPNFRPNPLVKGHPEDSPLFNRAAQGVYELGSTFKIFTAAMALDAGVAGMNTVFDVSKPIRFGRYRIHDYHFVKPRLTLLETMVESSNIGAAKLALMVGADAQKRMLGDLGMFKPTPLQLSEAREGRPLWPRRWTDLSTMTISYGHGIAATPLHLAAAYASVAGGGERVTPTLLKLDAVPRGRKRVISKATSRQVREILRAVVTDGTGRNAEVPGYEVGGKTGTADKPDPSGGYYHDRVISTFSAIFPSSNPRYVMVVTLDEPKDASGRIVRHTAGWTAAPVSAEAIARIAPLLGLAPSPVVPDQIGATARLASY